MTRPLRTEVLRRLAEIGRSATASDVAGRGARLSVTAVWEALADLWCDELVEGYPDGPWRLARAREAGPVAHDQMSIDGS